MRVLKAAMIIMGVFILAGYAYLGVEVVKRFSNKVSGDPREAAEERAGPAAAVQTGTVGLDLPAGARMSDPVAVGNRVVFRVTIPNGADRLYMLDPRSGAVTALVTTGKP